MIDKVSFARLPVAIDLARLRAELASIDPAAWQPTHWDYPHGSVRLLVLRGADTDTAADFYSPETADRPILATLPYLAELIGAEGPFGGAHFAYLFRMRPDGVAKLHTDGMPIWRRMYRVHIAIDTNPGAALVTGDGRACHFGAGEAWTFHNQELHGAVNGPTERTHLILDVPGSNPEMGALRATCEVVSGAPVSRADWERLQ
jgi:hypothetical protein